MPDHAYHVFVSSTDLDLRAEHAAIEAVLQRMSGFKYCGMKYFGSQSLPPLESSLAEVDRCQIYIGIFAGRYGSGITEAEYRRAVARNLHCLIYFKSETAIAPDDQESAPETRRRLAALKEELRNRHTISGAFAHPEELARQVATDLHELISFYSPT
jgi:hypothetical protein